MKKISILFLIFLLGCAPKLVQINSQERGNLKNQSVHVIYDVPSSFVVGSTAKESVGVLFGVVGALTAVSSEQRAGAKMVKEYQLVDPTLTLRDKFLGALKKNNLLTDFQLVPEEYKKDDIKFLQSKFKEGSVFDFKTISWGVFNDQVIYGVRARFIHFPEGKVLWQGLCNVNKKGAPSKKHKSAEFKADNGKLIKEELLQAADSCTNELLAHFSGIPQVVSSSKEINTTKNQTEGKNQNKKQENQVSR